MLKYHFLMAPPPNLNLLKIESLSLADLSLISKIQWYKNLIKYSGQDKNKAFIAFDKFLVEG